jgi:DNA-binding GntR family transcriptional regulator
MDDVANHEIIFDAINRGDGVAASEAMLRVILNGKSSLLSAMKPSG